jgi:hypothetical protein
MFLEYYLENANHSYKHFDDGVIFRQDSKKISLSKINVNKSLSIDAPVGVLRELQRHFITWRDFVWREGIAGLW